MIATIVVNLVVGIMIFFVLLLAMNGYGERDAEWGLLAFGALSLVILAASGGIAFFLAGILLKRNHRGLISGLISTTIAILIGTVLQLAASLAALLVTEAVRVNF